MGSSGVGLFVLFSFGVFFGNIPRPSDAGLDISYDSMITNVLPLPMVTYLLHPTLNDLV